ncbi:DUF5680 domain-containing protein [Acerihabitans sp. TG2]|uniref:DUF5680 domain-containing protein n=1 Tax=Acerihabitans sp. TG2 TaxID=3096008 RepID=UPI002B22945B|nr:DUF5680 domain-containing protein [Acerihabitans sp. TG2]MEA9389677.1 DUF5680 domain-containing protein [Acerihabitans sp. TG2]
MIPFLVEANQFLYRFPDNLIIRDTANGDMKLIEYSRDDYIYRNYFVGYRQVNGTIVVLINNEPVWIMAYEGGMTDLDLPADDIRKIFSFVRQNLARATVVEAIRGPSEFHNDRLDYQNRFFGTIHKFNGTETVMLKNQQLVYSLNYTGNDVIF